MYYTTYDDTGNHETMCNKFHLIGTYYFSPTYNLLTRIRHSCLLQLADPVYMRTCVLLEIFIEMESNIICYKKIISLLLLVFTISNSLLCFNIKFIFY